MKTIEIKNLSFKYNRKAPNVLKDINLICEPGSVNVLIGLNGSGKTTLIKIVAGLLDRYEGEVLIHEKRLRDMSVTERASLISYVSQRSGVADDFTVLDYLLFGKVNSLKFYQSPSPETELKVKQIAEKFHIEHLLDKKMGEISGGERQLVSICCAIVQDSQIIILDEPTSALDFKNQAIILSLIRNIAREENKTILMSSHNPNQALYMDGKVFLIKDGMVIKEGNAKGTITVETLKTVYGENISYSKDLPYNEVTFSE